jgi:hypothetical protein
MGEISVSLVKKLEAAGLTEEEKIVLALSTVGGEDAEVTGFGFLAIKDLESQDKLGNFEIQDLMARFNQSETLASSVVTGPIPGTRKRG